MTIRWQYFPKSRQCPTFLVAVATLFTLREESITSNLHKLRSNDVLAVLEPGLIELGYLVEGMSGKLKVPVLFGANGHVEKGFEADAVNYDTGTVIEVEAGRAYVNNQFLKDLFQACMMPMIKHLVIAVRNDYRGADDYSNVLKFIDTLYASGRLDLPLEGLLVIGY
jgi:hypothetical protein